MNIYFSCSLTGGRADQPIYQALVDFMQGCGHTIPTAHLSSAGVLLDEAIIDSETVFERDDRWVRECDLLVAEVSTPSHGVGYEIALAVSLNKPVLCLYRHDRTVSKMILGNPFLSALPYQTPGQALAILQDFLQNLTISSN